jgi:prepilin-type N-terminal cleavage/methylation domain-containing protein/prepilin-type processing-associated H-X9-DG protein
MNLYIKLQHRRGFNLFEVLVVVAVVALVAMVILPALTEPQSNRKSGRINCVNNLKIIGISARIWEGNHDDKYPMAVPAADGGAQEMMATGNVVACFQVMSNELSTSYILACPEDSRHRAATNWGVSRTNISYFMGLDAVESDPRAVLAGDANLVQHGRVVPSGVVNLATNITTWTRDRHGRTGNILLADGSVRFESTTEISSSAAPGAYASTNRVVVP